MVQHIGLIALLVNNYDEAITFYTSKMAFTLLEDRQQSGDNRWVVLSPTGAVETQLLLARAVSDEQKLLVGKQAGGMVFLILRTDDFHRDYTRMQQKGVNFLEEPRKELYGTVAIFEDLYGNRWDLLQPTRS